MGKIKRILHIIIFFLCRLFRIRGYGISLLVPLHVDSFGAQRSLNWRWLKLYWRTHLWGAEIVIGADDSAKKNCTPFSKSAAVNDAASKALGDILVIVDADVLVPSTAILSCAKEIRTAEKKGRKLWFIPYRKVFRLTQEASAKVLASPPWRPAIASYGISDEDITNTGKFDGTPISSIGHWYGAMIQMLSSTAFKTVGGWDTRFCVDESTQIFTKSGWKSRRDLNVGEPVLTLNHVTGFSEWQPVTAINYFYGQHDMLSIESKTHSSLTTLNHRWPTVQIRRPDRRAPWGRQMKGEVRGWSTSGRFADGSMVPTAADHVGLPTMPMHSDALVECVAWFWTEGSISRLRNGNSGRNVTISQSFVVNPSKCKRIRVALNGAFGSPSEFPRRGASATPDIPRWNEYPDRGKNIVFNLNAEAGSIMQRFAPNRVPTCDFLLSLTKSQLDLFIECSLLGDGSSRVRNYDVVLGQKNPNAVEAFQFACILAGHCTSTATNKKLARYDYGMTCLRIRQQKRFKLRKGKHSILTVEGSVWCPTTANGTWLARRSGKVYFTGNSGWGGEDHAAMVATDTLYGPHKTLSTEVIHLWHPVITESPADDPTGRKRLWANQQASGVNNALSGRYYWARGNARRMRQLVDEFKKK